MRSTCLLLLLATSIACQAQSSTGSRSAADQNSESGVLKSSRRQITVNGFAEKEVSPDIIYISVSLKEYFSDNAQKVKVPIVDLERSFLRTVYDLGISSADVSIEGISGYGNWGPKRKSENYLASKRYQLKLADLDKINNLMSRVDPKAVSSMYISGYDYSKMADIKKSLRIEAMRDASVKAAYMIAALNESLGPVIEAEEQDSGSPGGGLFMARMMAENSSAADLEFKKVKVNSTVKVTFQIQDNR